jgi:hypothetical protein
MRRPSRRAVLAVAGVAVVAGVWALVAPRTGDDTLAARRFLEEMGRDVRFADAPPAPPATFVLLEDARSPDQTQDLLSWVESGGRLVVADRASPALVVAGVHVQGDAGFVGLVTLPTSCIARPSLGLTEIVVDARDAMLVSREADATACFVRGDGAYAVVREVGDGDVVLLGGRSFMTNDFIDRADNAAFLLGVVGEGPVVFGPAVPPGSEPPSLWELLPGPARGIVVGIVVAAAAFAIARARRLGRPVLEPVPAPIAASELVRAAAGLYRRAHATGFSAEILRSSAKARLARGVGLLPGEDVDRLSTAVSDAARIPEHRVRAALAGAEPAGDDELIALGRELHAIVEATEGATR